MFKQVEDFNLQIVCVPPNRTPGELPLSEKKWLVGALKEEISEFEEAYDNSDFVGSIDAIMDLIYFAKGGLTRMGIRSEVSEEIFMAIHNANMQKKPGTKEDRDVKHELDAVKPDDWQSPEMLITGILEKHYGR